MKKLLTLGIFCVMFILIGAGCTSSTDQTQQNAEAENNTAEKNNMVDTSDRAALPPDPIEDFTLTVEEQRGDEVTFSWQLPDRLDNPEKFRLIRSDEPAPIYDGKHYWVQAHGTWREIVWEEFPTSTQYVRVCTFDVKKEACMAYSGDAVVNGAVE